MSRWNDAFESHAFKTSWNSINELLASEGFITGEAEGVGIEVARLKKVVAYIDGVIEQIDPELMPFNILDGMNQHSTQCLQQLNAFQGNQNVGHLQNANTNIDAVLSLIGTTPFILSGYQKGSLSKAANAYSEAIDEHLARLSKNIDTEVESVRSELVDINGSISTNKTALTALDNELKVVSQTVEKQTSEFNTQFQASETKRTANFDKVIETQQTKVDSTFKDIAIKSGITIEVLDKYLEDAKNIFGVVVNSLQAGAYSSYANEEKQMANRLRWSAIALMVLGVSVLVVPEIIKMVNSMETYALDWKITLGRIPFSLILFVPAFYLARESSKHRNTEVINRRRELILATIDPYLALLDEEQAKTIKEDIAKGIFSEGGQGSSDGRIAESSNVVAQIANLVKQVKGK